MSLINSKFCKVIYIKKSELMKNIVFLIISTAIICCNSNPGVSEREILELKVEAFQFLNKNHDQLHIMIGEEDGNIKIAYEEFFNALVVYDNNELIPIKDALLRIKPGDLNPKSENVKRLDYLVDYYQSGLSIQIEGILRGYGYLKTFSLENAINIYDTITKKSD